MILHNFKVKKYLYKKDLYFIWYQIDCNKYVITKIKNFNKENLIKILKRFKNSKNVNFATTKLVTWLDCK